MLLHNYFCILSDYTLTSLHQDLLHYLLAYYLFCYANSKWCIVFEWYLFISSVYISCSYISSSNCCTIVHKNVHITVTAKTLNFIWRFVLYLPSASSFTSTQFLFFNLDDWLFCCQEDLQLFDTPFCLYVFMIILIWAHQQLVAVFQVIYLEIL